MTPTGAVFSVDDLLKFLADGNVTDNRQLYSILSTTNVARLKYWRHWLDRVRSYKIPDRGSRGKQRKGKQSRYVGKLFERVVRVLFDDCLAIKHAGNVNSTVAEIDFLLKIEPLGRAVSMLAENGTHAMGEAKCVNGALKTEWITELGGLLPIHNASLGILFTMEGPRKLQSQARFAIALHAGKGQRIVPFGRTQFDAVANGDPFLSILSDQYVKSASHTADLSI